MTYICIDIGAANMVCQCHMIWTSHVIIHEGAGGKIAKKSLFHQTENGQNLHREILM